MVAIYHELVTTLLQLIFPIPDGVPVWFKIKAINNGMYHD